MSGMLQARADGGSHRPAVLALALGLLVIVTFLPALDQPFLAFDDLRSAPGLEPLRQGLDASTLRWALGANLLGNWIPATTVSHLLDWELFGDQPRGHYLTNLLLHAAAAVTLFLFWGRATGGAWGRAWLATALFALHPLRVESVAWIVERKDVLSGLFAGLTLLAWLRHVRRPSAGRYLLAWCTFAIGLTAKASLVTLPLLLLLLDFWPLARLRPREAGAWLRLGRLAGEKAPLLVASFAVSLATLRYQAAGEALAAGLPPLWRLGNAALAAAAYLRHTVWPTGLAVFYPLPSKPPAPASVLAALLALAVLTALAVALRRRQPWLAVGWAWFLVALVPMAGLVQVGRQASADRYTYLPSVGLCVAVVWAVDALVASRAGSARGRTAATAIALAAVAACMVATRLQLRHWRSDEALFRRAAAVTSGNFLAHSGLGHALDRAGRHEEAAWHHVRALQIAPGRGDFYPPVAAAFRRAGDLAEAERVLRRGRLVDPGSATIAGDLGEVLLAGGRAAEAVEPLARAVLLDPRQGRVAALHEALREAGRVAAAAGLREALAAGDGPGRQRLESLLERVEADSP